MMLRIASALVLIPLALLLVLYATQPYYLAALATIGTLVLREYFGLAERLGARGQPWLAYSALWFLIWGMHFRPVPSYMLFAAVLLVAFVAAMWRPIPMRDRVLGLQATLFGILYVTLCLYPLAR